MFGKCYCVRIGPINACLKIFRFESKYANTFFNKIHTLIQVSHKNIPWLYGMCYDAKHPRAIAMTYHPFCGGKSATVHATLHDKVSQVDWKTVLTGETAALVYLWNQQILHNDIKGDNIMIEYLPPDYKSCRSVLIDFVKVCFISETMLYKL